MKLIVASIAFLAGFAAAAPVAPKGASPKTADVSSSVISEPTMTDQVGPQATGNGHGSSPSQTAGSDDGSSSSNGGGGGKRGIDYTDASLTHLFPKPPISWAYNYQSVPNSGASKNHEFVPMLYNGQEQNWHQNAQAAIHHGSKHLLAFNEPDQPTSVGGTNIEPTQAAKIYKAKMNPFKGKAKLGAPAISAGGFDWLKNFAHACGGHCHVDFIPLHFYADQSQSVKVQAESLKGFMNETIPKVRGLFNDPHMPIWVTEFSALPFANVNPHLNAQYMNDVLPYLENNNDIQRYSYYFANDLASGGHLNEAGTRYIKH
jgi:Glycosyl hydrolase catalytic core